MDVAGMAREGPMAESGGGPSALPPPPDSAIGPSLAMPATSMYYRTVVLPRRHWLPLGYAAGDAPRTVRRSPGAAHRRSAHRRRRGDPRRRFGLIATAAEPAARPGDRPGCASRARRRPSRSASQGAIGNMGGVSVAATGTVP